MNNLWNHFENEAKKYSSHVQIGTFEYSINISLKHSYLFTETPKVACSTIKTILQKMELDNPSFHRDNFEDIHNRDFSPLLRPSQVWPLDSFIDGKQLYKFCFSRNPYTRLLSAYIDKISRNQPEKKSILRCMGENPSKLDTKVSFDEFVEVVSRQNIIDMNPHWRIQYYQTFQNHIRYNHIGKIENFDLDIKTILENINPNYKRFLSTEKRHATNANTLLQDHYTPSIITKVREKFERDFEFFNYDYALPKV